jgi:hypothetical protein
MGATTYPKKTVLDRMQQFLDAMPAALEKELDDATREQKTYIADMEQHVKTMLPELLDSARKAADDFINVIDTAESLPFNAQLKAASAVREALYRVDRNLPSLGYSNNNDKSSAIELRYTARRDELTRKMQFVREADAEQGFTLSALEKLDLIKFVK